MDDVPFFDVHLPYELAINIFQYLNRRELGLCAQVSSRSHVAQGPLALTKVRGAPSTVDLQNHTVDRADGSKHSGFLKGGPP